MNTVWRTDGPCPCGSGAAYCACCGPLHGGEPAPSAERLMRSRFSAFALGLPEYLLRSWDPHTRPDRSDFDLDDTVEWRRLFIADTTGGGPDDDAGFVTFTAIGRGQDGRFEQRERSRFARGADGHWRYVDGDAA
ncbi:SEC-C motif-containing protein [Leucobacter luti]|uniref:SEC-C motif-containing protein n=2 Tax=Leucobacter luti TaxID=340320 RepID=A0A4R6RRG1_9MICO|nr:YchJ family metal-binding protein [Leucobacter luti]TDP89350.1 SEC-C motif-containing protein [Leucobacter luti]